MMVFPYPDPLVAPVAFNGDKANIPLTTETVGYASLTEGFPLATQLPLAAGGVSPRRVDFNGVLNLLSQWVVWAQNGGMAMWAADRNYQVPALVSYDGILYWCLKDNGPDIRGAVQPGTNAEVWEVVGEGGDSNDIGDIALKPFRPADLPTGWHYCNGGGLVLSSPQGQALANLPAALKNDFKITVSGSIIYKPNLLTGGAVAGQGPFFRPSTSPPGTLIQDAIRNITGNWTSNYGIHTGGASFTGAFLNPGGTPMHMGGDNGTSGSGIGFDASRVVPTAAENRPFHIALTPAIWLGC